MSGFRGKRLHVRAKPGSFLSLGIEMNVIGWLGELGGGGPNAIKIRGRFADEGTEANDERVVPVERLSTDEIHPRHGLCRLGQLRDGIREGARNGAHREKLKTFIGGDRAVDD